MLGANGYYWGRRAAGVIIIDQAKQQFLLLLRSESVENPGIWGIPGGKIDPGEDALTAARREVAEEIGKTWAREDFLKIYPEPVDVWQAPDADFQFSTYVGVVPYDFHPRLNWENTDYIWEYFDSLRGYKPGSQQDRYTTVMHPNVYRVLRRLRDRLMRQVTAKRFEIAPRRFYVSVGLDAINKEWARPWHVDEVMGKHADIQAGRLRGIRGISASPRNVVDWFGVAREAMLMMDGPTTLDLNRRCLFRLQYENPHFLVADEYYALRRIWQVLGTHRKPADDQHVFSNMLDYIRQVSRNINGDLFYKLAWHGGHDYLKTIPKEGSVRAMTEWLRAGAKQKDKLDIPYAQAETIITTALKKVGEVYSSEAEWLIKTGHGCDGSLLVPKGSHLFVLVGNKEHPEYSSYNRDRVQLVSQLGLTSFYNVHFVTHKDLDEYKKRFFAKGSKP